MAKTILTTTKNAVIDAAASLSAVIDLEGYIVSAIEMPAAWTAAGLTFQACSTKDGTFVDLYDDGGTEVSANAAASRAVAIDAAAGSLSAIRYLKVRSGTSAAPVVQAAERTLVLILKA